MRTFWGLALLLTFNMACPGWANDCIIADTAKEHFESHSGSIVCQSSHSVVCDVPDETVCRQSGKILFTKNQFTDLIVISDDEHYIAGFSNKSRMNFWLRDANGALLRSIDSRNPAPDAEPIHFCERNMFIDRWFDVEHANVTFEYGPWIESQAGPLKQITVTSCSGDRVPMLPGGPLRLHQLRVLQWIGAGITLTLVELFIISDWGLLAFAGGAIRYRHHGIYLFRFSL